MVNQHVTILSCEHPIFFISDVHSNLPALQSVLAEIPVGSTVVCAGDLLGYYTEPNEVCELLRSRSVICIKGNHDKYVLGELNYAAERELKYRITANREALTRNNYRWLAELPDTLSLKVVDAAGGQLNGIITVAHGNLVSSEVYVYPDSISDFELPKGSDFLILGHTHHPMLRISAMGTLMNPGSVGQARDRVPGACYAAVNALTRETVFFRATYDIAKYQGHLYDVGVLSSMVDVLSRTK
jgi:predicted phosphodiesterase